jgi:hypothetical protein
MVEALSLPFVQFNGFSFSTRSRGGRGKIAQPCYQFGCFGDAKTFCPVDGLAVLFSSSFISAFPDFF